MLQFYYKKCKQNNHPRQHPNQTFAQTVPESVLKLEEMLYFH